ncbi:hypothetical protein GZ989_003815 [Campylobacter fetus]|uniref:hypothetical protein n=1 Tax=Campylobacter fetus TaxID=196 RepID=UPI00112FC030|nr:hypothetical protein [Campylobacter fetus]EAI3887227.1 hypothetical protein [Campylobacter fetus]KAA3684566.1 hypothetical protein E3U40_06240 [Campylobacter fetus subsp. venerealis]KAA3687866.1 hypothetical protein E3U42_02460 [Campylobacter fetus subsp. fetus]MBK3500457.1 hypothetical protein [Campylobacter fetus subsp. venerealis]MBK3502392.1 hypothetical protein [Campylobacter fetus subsp. venerealis]
MDNEYKEALYCILYAKLMQYDATLDAIKSVLTDEQQTQIRLKINELSNGTRKNGSLDLLLGKIKPDALDLP